MSVAFVFIFLAVISPQNGISNPAERNGAPPSTLTIIKKFQRILRNVSALNPNPPPSEKDMATWFASAVTSLTSSIKELKKLMHTGFKKIQDDQLATTSMMSSEIEQLKGGQQALKQLLVREVIRFPNPIFGIAGDGRYYVQGHVEILYKGQWGTICDDGFNYKIHFGNNGANILCKMGGYKGGTYDLGLYKQVGANKAKGIWLDDVRCDRNDYFHIDQCLHAPWGAHNCAKKEDVGIRCYY